MSVASCSSSMACDMEEVCSESSKKMKDMEETTSEASLTTVTKGKEKEVWGAIGLGNEVKGVSVNLADESHHRHVRAKMARNE